MNSVELWLLNPVGKTVAYSDGALPPPARHTNKLRAWRRNNNRGVFIERATSAYGDYFTLKTSSGPGYQINTVFSTNDARQLKFEVGV